MQTKILRNSHIYIREDRRQEKNSIRDDEGYFIMIKGSLHLEDGIILNVYVHNTRTTKYIKQKLTELRGETNKSTQNSWRHQHSSLSTWKEQVHWKSSKDKEDSNSTINWIDVYRTFQPTTAKYKLLYCPWNTHQDSPSTEPGISLNKFLKIETTHSILYSLSTVGLNQKSKPKWYLENSQTSRNLTSSKIT